ncbi:MAG: DUF362 domain-containing protein [Candidatus Hodarchaeales archaeon]
MSKSQVYMMNTEDLTMGDSLIDRLEHLWKQPEVGLNDWINKGEIVAIKTHFGSRNQTRHLRSMYIRKVVDLVRAAGGIPWVCEGVGLGWDSGSPELTMSNGPGFVYLASRHGFNIAAMDAPVVMDDGIVGTEVFHVNNDKGIYIKRVALAMGLRTADKVLIVSRFKGHDGAGFGGALKQLGIGCVGNEGKGGAHWGGGENIYVKNPDNCDGCGKCLRICPYECLSLDENNRIVHNPENCIACTMCFSKCHHGKDIKTERVFALKRRVPSVEQVTRMMDNAGGVVKGIEPERLRYINIAIDITSHCDCMTAGGHTLVPDQGILFSKDPIAIDQASVDLVTKAQGVPMSPADTGLDSPHGRIEPDKKAMAADGAKLGLYSLFVDPDSRPIIAETQLAAAFTQGIGSREYDLNVIPSPRQKK